MWVVGAGYEVDGHDVRVLISFNRERERIRM
jgi:hypothetical protein